jgi:hypothetical protein
MKRFALRFVARLQSASAGLGDVELNHRLWVAAGPLEEVDGGP